VSSDLEVSVALSDNPRTRPLIEGRVVPQGLRPRITAVHPSEMFWRQLKFGDFDISEMSMSSLTVATSRGPTPWVAIPVFTTRMFFHTGILVRNDRGIEAPADLKGKKVGIPEYQQTAALWVRGVLEREFGVHARDMEWFMERNPDKSHGGSTGFKPPEGVRMHYIPPASSIGDMLEKGELDAALLYLRENNLVDRSSVDVSQLPTVRTLFPDPEAEKRRYFAKTGIYPINHCVVIRRSLHEKHPWIALNLYTAFKAAKEEGYAAARTVLHPQLESGIFDDKARQAINADPLAYGIRGPRAVLEMIPQMVHEQGLAPRRVALEELFAPSTMDL
jgi:4,5-dihydroxyphthalate decarboxylase